MLVEYYYKSTMELVEKEYAKNYLFVMDGEVFEDNGKSYESQPSSICFDDFTVEKKDIGWRIVDDDKDAEIARLTARVGELEDLISEISGYLDPKVTGQINTVNTGSILHQKMWKALSERKKYE